MVSLRVVKSLLYQTKHNEDTSNKGYQSKQQGDILVATEPTGNPPAPIFVKDCSPDAFICLPPYVPILLNVKKFVCLMMSGHRRIWGWQGAWYNSKNTVQRGSALAPTSPETHHDISCVAIWFGHLQTDLIGSALQGPSSSTRG